MEGPWCSAGRVRRRVGVKGEQTQQGEGVGRGAWVASGSPQSSYVRRQARRTESSYLIVDTSNLITAIFLHSYALPSQPKNYPQQW